MELTSDTILFKGQKREIWIQKGAAAQSGEIREWQGKKMQKQGDGTWKEVTEGKQPAKKEEEGGKSAPKDVSQEQIDAMSPEDKKKVVAKMKEDENMSAKEAYDAVTGESKKEDAKSNFGQDHEKKKEARKETANADNTMKEHFKDEYDEEVTNIREQEDQFGASYKEVETDGAEYMVFESDEDAERHARGYVEDMIDDDPSMFNQDFLKDYITISDMDKEIMAGEEVDAQLDGMDEEEIVEQYSEHGDNEDDIREAMAAEIEKELDDPIDYFVEQHGMYSIEDLMEANFVQIDSKAAARAAVDMDGVGHFLSSYDGEERTMADGKAYFRTN